MMTRTLLAALTSAAFACAGVDGTYHFTTPQTAQSMQEAATILRTVAQIPQVSIDASNASLTFNGPADGVNLAAWILPQIDRTAGDNTIHESPLPNGEVARVNFVPNAATPQQMQEILTILRTVADVQRIFNFTPNRALVFRGPEWQISFTGWIVEQLGQTPDSTPRQFTVGGPDVKGTGHGARVNFLTNATAPQQTQQVLTVLRTVGDIAKVFNYTSAHALVLRAAGTDLERAEWLIQQLDIPAAQATGNKTYTSPSGDDITRVFYLTNTTPQGLQAAVSGIRTELRINKAFSTTSPSALIVRGTTDQIGAATQWMAAHNALAALEHAAPPAAF